MSFDPKLCETYVRSLINHDEVERALLVLDNIPAYYRDHIPQNLVKLRESILSSLITSHAYMHSGLDSNVSVEKATAVLKGTLRGMLIEAEVKRYNAKGKKPHIVDMGPGEYFVPISLLSYGLQFTYHDIVLDKNTQLVAHPLIQSVKSPSPSPDQPTIFLALEVIEHLPNTGDIVTEALRHTGRMPDRVHLSTPMYTYDNSDKQWEKPCGLPHLRAYTPSEFVKEAHKLFPFFAWQHYDGVIQSVRGVNTVSDYDKEPII